MSKNSLIKKLQIAMHELAIYQRYELSKQKLESMAIESINKEFI
jgi:hypothetical protein